MRAAGTIKAPETLAPVAELACTCGAWPSEIAPGPLCEKGWGPLPKYQVQIQQINLKRAYKTVTVAHNV